MFCLYPEWYSAFADAYHTTLGSFVYRVYTVVYISEDPSNTLGDVVISRGTTCLAMSTEIFVRACYPHEMGPLIADILANLETYLVLMVL